MFGSLSGRSQLTRADAAAAFGTALAARASSADLVQFGTGSAPVRLRQGESVLPTLERFGDLGGTRTAAAVRRHYRVTPGSFSSPTSRPGMAFAGQT
jgi:hypothetical protein